MRLPFALPRALLALVLAATGCSLVLARDSQQCAQNSDCEALGFDSYQCDTAAKVCVRGGTAGAPGAAGSGAVAGNAGSSAAAGANQAGQGAVAGSFGEAGSNQAGGGSPTTSAGSGGSGTSGSGGYAGSAAGSAGSTAGSAPIPEWPVLAPPSSGTRVRVRSFCEKKVWVRAVSAGGTVLIPSNAPLETNGVVNLLAPPEWQGGQVFVYGTAASGEELHLFAASVSAGVTYFSLQYLREFGLPAQIVGVGGTCTAAAHTRSCLAREADVASCPESFLKDGARCLAPSVYCGANPNAAYCHALDAAITACAGAGCPGGSTVDVYAGLNGYAENARWAAALNRGMSKTPDSKDSSLFYRQAPYNTYAKWVHELCPKTVAFTHDDFNATDPLYAACNATELRITLCPAR